ncbi:hypothetical protein [Halobacterium sp. R2-5]|uniref:hypothetical protein n=1 Tax=Halobacterium sp. R2-5 TaxID=2715751 RepID=UPI00142008F6|nr:hypothetical protein [Halobacterium sp. R2-5]NIC00992.1 hypothetical protein [Halobacterium sp. R2-5]
MTASKRRAALAVGVALLLVTAGCSGGTTPSSTTENTDTPTTTTTATPTTTASSTTTAGTWSPNVSVEQYPPGVADNGTLTNHSELINAHFDATANKSMELTYRESPSSQEDVYRYAHGSNKTPFLTFSNRSDETVQMVEERYQTDTHGYERMTGNNGHHYFVTQNEIRDGFLWVTEPEQTARYELTGFFYAGNYTVNGTVERDGRTFVELTANESTFDNVSSYDGRALIAPEGVIHSAELSLPDPETEGEYYNYSASLDTDVNWSGAPSWVADLPHLSVSMVEDGHALELRNTGGATLPANASFEVYVKNMSTGNQTDIHRSNADATGNITTGAPLEPGDAVYVTGHTEENSTSFTLHDERVRGEYRFPTAKIVGKHENIQFELVTGLVEDNATV